MHKNYYTKEWEKKIKETCLKSQSMMAAALQLGIHYATLRAHAIRLGVFKPNPAGNGIKKRCTNAHPLEDILSNKIPYWGTHNLKLKLLKLELLIYHCYECKMVKWRGKKISLELDHIDGIRANNNLKNLRLLCPNCHSQTSTFRSKNRKDQKE